MSGDGILVHTDGHVFTTFFIAVDSSVLKTDTKTETLRRLGKAVEKNACFLQKGPSLAPVAFSFLLHTRKVRSCELPKDYMTLKDQCVIPGPRVVILWRFISYLVL